MFVRLLLVIVISTVAWAGFVHPSEATSPAREYVVKPGDTLWAVAATHYAGDPREAIWRVQQANALEGVMLRPGQRLTLP
jgi:LysM repeat protein